MDSARGSRPTVSVAMITYNHERYIVQALESVLSQITTFQIEIVIGNDSSRDRTAKEIDALAIRLPSVIRAFHRPTNMGMQKNLEDVLSNCRGEFVAFLEGDDYWTSDQKLQRQVDLLRARQDLVGVCHPVTVVNGASEETGEVLPARVVSEIRTADLLTENTIYTPSAMVRRHALVQLPNSFRNLKMRDWPMWVYASFHGLWSCLPNVMAAYRIHDTANWSNLPFRMSRDYEIDLFRAFTRELPKPHATMARRTLAQKTLEAFELAIKEQRLTDARLYLTNVIRLLPYYEQRYVKRAISAAWEIISPSTHRIAKRRFLRKAP